MDEIQILKEDRGEHGIQFRLLIDGKEVSYWLGQFFRDPVEYEIIVNLFANMVYNNLMKDVPKVIISNK